MSSPVGLWRPRFGDVLRTETPKTERDAQVLEGLHDLDGVIPRHRPPGTVTEHRSHRLFDGKPQPEFSNVKDDHQSGVHPVLRRFHRNSFRHDHIIVRIQLFFFY